LQIPEGAMSAASSVGRQVEILEQFLLDLDDNFDDEASTAPHR
jgi:hypothetical protein